MDERFDDRMNASDTTLWRIERDPALRTTILGVALLGGTPEWHRLRERIATVTTLVPRFRQRVVSPGLGGGSPRWVDDPTFDLDFHLRRIVAPAPADLPTVYELAAPVVMAPFDRDRPLWEFTLVEGLADGGAALLQKIHHSSTDGVGAVRMARLLFDDGPPPPPPVEPPRGPARADDALARLLHGWGDQWRQAAEAAQHGIAALPHLLETTVRHPARAVDGAVRTTESLAKLMRPVSEPLSPVMRRRGLSRRVTGLELPLDGMMTAAHRARGSLNDAFLAALAGGMARYHRRHGAEVPSLRVTMPINLRRGDDPIGNNRFTPVRLHLPLDVEDPVERMRRLHEITGSWRREPGLRFTGTVAGVLNLLPEPVTAAVLGSMLKAVDLVASNVPGLDEPVALAGVPVLRQYAFAPPSGAAFSATLHSYAGGLTLGLMVDTAAVTDPAVLVECVQEGIDEILEIRPTRRTRR
jgi:WS/DGAT/MGAT family acyltransferase